MVSLSNQNIDRCWVDELLGKYKIKQSNFQIGVKFCFQVPNFSLHTKKIICPCGQISGLFLFLDKSKKSRLPVA